MTKSNILSADGKLIWQRIKKQSNNKTITPKLAELFATALKNVFNVPDGELGQFYETIKQVNKVDQNTAERNKKKHTNKKPGPR